MKKNILSPSILSVDFLNLGSQIKAVDAKGVKYLHIDVMDGHFVPEVSFGNPIVATLRPITDMFFDVHLMVSNPLSQIDCYARDGANLITIHVEADDNVDEVIDRIHSHGIAAGLSVKPGTSIEKVLPYLDKVELILVMSVEPGYAAQQLIEDCLVKISDLRKIIDDRGLDVDIEIDGGVKIDNVDRVLAAGANVIVIGSGVFKGNLDENLTTLLAKIDNA